jgi:ribosomal protein S18 acetylase RimI-like enzyme
MHSGYALGKASCANMPGVSDDAITIELESAETIDELRDLWLEVHARHQQAGPGIAAYRSDDDSWAQRRDSYAEWLAMPDSFLLVARREGRAIGYALVKIEATSADWSDTWQVGERVAGLETLSVTAAERNNGLGSALMDRVEEELAARKVDDVLIGVVVGNDGAQRLYERRGYRPTWLLLSRFASRDD